MTPTIFGLFVVVLGLALLARVGLPGLLAFVMLCSLMGGTGAIFLPMLGGSSITPGSLAIAFLLAGMLWPAPARGALWREAAWANRMLLIFCVYGVVGALSLPWLFAGKMNVTPMRAEGLTYLYDTYPLAFSNQNITAACYLLGTAIAALGAYMAGRQPQGARLFVQAAIAVALIHALLGISGALFEGTGYAALLDLARNGAYAQLNQHYAGFARMNGIWPEPSAFAAFGLVWCILMIELWLRDVMPRWTGVAAVISGIALLGSTSSTAYVGLPVYALILLARWLLIGGLTREKAVRIGGLILIAALVGLLFLMLWPALSERALTLLEHMTVDKVSSGSAHQRSFWAWQGWDAFLFSYGIGIGAGSFRSSSLLAAIIGSMGIVGMVSFLAYCWQVVKPLRLSSYVVGRPQEEAIGAAAGWTAIGLLIPLAVSAPSPDPGMPFAIVAGMALALRRREKDDSAAAASIWGHIGLPGWRRKAA